MDGDEPRVLAEFGVQDVMNSGLFGFDQDNTHAYLVDSRDRNTAALVKMNLETGATVELAGDARADISNVLIDPVTYAVRAYATEYTRLAWRGLDDEARVRE